MNAYGRLLQASPRPLQNLAVCSVYTFTQTVNQSSRTNPTGKEHLHGLHQRTPLPDHTDCRITLAASAFARNTPVQVYCS
jgi:hypothetical protein